MEYPKNPREAMAADLPDLSERLSAVGATVEQFEAFRRAVACGAATQQDPMKIETKEQ